MLETAPGPPGFADANTRQTSSAAPAPAGEASPAMTIAAPIVAYAILRVLTVAPPFEPTVPVRGHAAPPRVRRNYDPPLGSDSQRAGSIRTVLSTVLQVEGR